MIPTIFPIFTIFNAILNARLFGFEFQIFSFYTSEILIVNRDFIGFCLYLPIYNEFFK